MILRNVFFVVFILFLLAGCNTQQVETKVDVIDYNAKYNEVIELLRVGEFNQAQEQIKTLPVEYEDKLKLLNAYIDARQFIKGYQLDDKDTQTIDTYYKKMRVLNDIIRYTSIDTADFIYDFNENIKSALSKIESKKIIELLDAGDYETAQEYHKNLMENDKTWVDSNNYTVLNALIFADKYKKDNDYSNYMSYLYSISVDYDGYYDKYVEKERKEFSDIVKTFIKNKNYNDVSTLLYSVRDRDDKYEWLYEYVMALKQEAEKDKSMTVAYLSDIPKDYDGIFADEVQAMMAKYKKEIDEKLRIRKMIADEEKKPNPRIGMSAEEVKKSKWGEPQRVNTTITAYGVREQWVYSGYKYIYLDNGIVTAIQQ